MQCRTVKQMNNQWPVNAAKRGIVHKYVTVVKKRMNPVKKISTEEEKRFPRMKGRHVVHKFITVVKKKFNPSTGKEDVVEEKQLVAAKVPHESNASNDEAAIEQQKNEEASEKISSFTGK
ncbi:hypothetical protein TVAG_094200 [Trichomonas vaginalis G3]|uniref:Uncharacterized protein n=1 Tax=Trichomonas vaginalis (strain ATCC PRA-98 / G3) TaxID=412133 RepID=A2DBP2_TRIV3|nr:hypothetical protein TVAGG3_0390310 [Trichomonas vaginalis G3]EAY09683.1 hypothetical protein TVAG_098190 [Trichomonas vaginalis G3]EAY22245.1 hypothetical protein TVAG_094200 [Trichomonas vaginalis G3]KAI5533940.1 hypothetical protein TVAGG3_0390310 [Trichomonas vaginalis G3]|eukprot:XP_001321906.1 hypothetical protein [Trichomonas vaginalis G3]